MIAHKTWTWLIKRNLKRETEYLLVTAQNDAIRTYCIKTKIDNKRQNRKCSLCGDIKETVNRIISESSKLAQKEYKTRYNWAGKMISLELSRDLKFGHTTKWYIHLPESVLENEMH